MGGAHVVESVAVMPWNGWRLCRGMGGAHAVESVAELLWNTHRIEVSVHVDTDIADTQGER